MQGELESIVYWRAEKKRAINISRAGFRPVRPCEAIKEIPNSWVNSSLLEWDRSEGAREKDKKRIAQGGDCDLVKQSNRHHQMGNWGKGRRQRIVKANPRRKRNSGMECLNISKTGVRT